MSKSDVAKIRQELRRYVAAVNTGDIDGWLSRFTSNCVWMPPDTPRLKGKKAMAAFAESAFFDPFTIRLKEKANRVQVFGKQAFTSGSFNLELTPKTGGNTLKTTGKYMDMLAKQKDGSWKFAERIFNFDKPPA
jgi:uncharacterized protein (TIGR02246 family)